MDAQFESLGIWLDFTNAYQTVKPGIHRSRVVDARPGAEEKGML